MKKTEYEQLLKVYRQQPYKQQLDTNMDASHIVLRNGKTSGLLAILSEDCIIKEVKLSPLVIALYKVLKSHPVSGLILDAVGIESLDDFVNASVLAYWRRNGIEITVINLKELERLENEMSS